jgi:transcriptional regulator with XRE-family HTH domain
VDNLSIFAERITELKEEYNLSNLQFEKICGCKNQSISSWLTKGVYPKLVNLMRLSDYFNCSIDYILGLTDNKYLSRREIPIPFLTRISELLTKNHISEYALAKACDFNRSSFVNWRKRNLLPQTECLIRIAEYFNCSVEYLLGLSDSF